MDDELTHIVCQAFISSKMDISKALGMLSSQLLTS